MDALQIDSTDSQSGSSLVDQTVNLYNGHRAERGRVSKSASDSTTTTPTSTSATSHRSSNPDHDAPKVKGTMIPPADSSSSESDGEEREGTREVCAEPRAASSSAPQTEETPASPALSSVARADTADASQISEGALFTVSAPQPPAPQDSLGAAHEAGNRPTSLMADQSSSLNFTVKSDQSPLKSLLLEAPRREKVVTLLSDASATLDFTLSDRPASMAAHPQPDAAMAASATVLEGSSSVNFSVGDGRSSTTFGSRLRESSRFSAGEGQRSVEGLSAPNDAGGGSMPLPEELLPAVASFHHDASASGSDQRGGAESDTSVDAASSEGEGEQRARRPTILPTDRIESPAQVRPAEDDDAVDQHVASPADLFATPPPPPKPSQMTLSFLNNSDQPPSAHEELFRSRGSETSDKKEPSKESEENDDLGGSRVESICSPVAVVGPHDFGSEVNRPRADSQTPTEAEEQTAAVDVDVAPDVLQGQYPDPDILPDDMESNGSPVAVAVSGHRSNDSGSEVNRPRADSQTSTDGQEQTEAVGVDLAPDVLQGQYPDPDEQPEDNAREEPAESLSHSKENTSNATASCSQRENSHSTRQPDVRDVVTMHSPSNRDKVAPLSPTDLYRDSVARLQEASNVPITSSLMPRELEPYDDDVYEDDSWTGAGSSGSSRPSGVSTPAESLGARPSSRSTHLDLDRTSAPQMNATPPARQPQKPSASATSPSVSRQQQYQYAHQSSSRPESAKVVRQKASDVTMGYKAFAALPYSAQVLLMESVEVDGEQCLRRGNTPARSATPQATSATRDRVDCAALFGYRVPERPASARAESMSERIERLSMPRARRSAELATHSPRLAMYHYDAVFRHPLYPYNPPPPDRRSRYEAAAIALEVPEEADEVSENVQEKLTNVNPIPPVRRVSVNAHTARLAAPRPPQKDTWMPAKVKQLNHDGLEAANARLYVDGVRRHTNALRTAEKERNARVAAELRAASAITARHVVRDDAEVARRLHDEDVERRRRNRQALQRKLLFRPRDQQAAI